MRQLHGPPLLAGCVCGGVGVGAAPTALVLLALLLLALVGAAAALPLVLPRACRGPRRARLAVLLQQRAVCAIQRLLVRTERVLLGQLGLLLRLPLLQDKARAGAGRRDALRENERYPAVRCTRRK